jgi:hypothetical protein
MPKRKTRHKKAVEAAILETAMKDPGFAEAVNQATPEDVRKILDEVLWGRKPRPGRP